MPQKVVEISTSYSLLQVLSPIVGLVINVLAQIFGSRYISSMSLLKSVFLGFFVGLLSVFIIEFYVDFAFAVPSKDFISYFISNTIIYISLGYCYFQFINLGETARRIRILRELYGTKDGLNMEGILNRYNAGGVVEMRINRLLANGQIILKNDRYFIGRPFMLLIAKIIKIIKLIVIGKKLN
jgi:hypothetical protein